MPRALSHLIPLECCLVMSRNREAHHYAVFSSLLLLRPSLGPDIFIRTHFSNFLGHCASLTMRDFV